jgi:hypothetical protein
MTTNEIRRIENSTFMNDKDTRVQCRGCQSKVPESIAAKVTVAKQDKSIRKAKDYAASRSERNAIASRMV